MPRAFGQNENGANTTRQKGLRNKRRTGRSTYSLKGKGKNAERYSRPYLTGEYRTWNAGQSLEPSPEGVASRPRQATGHNKSKRAS